MAGLLQDISCVGSVVEQRDPLLQIEGGRRLSGEISCSGAKNAVLPMMCAALLTAEPVVLTHVPELQDVVTMQRLLSRMGVRITKEGDRMVLEACTITSPVAPYEWVKAMRASILVLGPLLARLGEAVVSLPGGCAIGARPVDQHLKGLAAMGAEVRIEHGDIHARALRLVGARIVPDVVTVTGTENLLMAATLAEGVTVIENAAREPEVQDLARLLQKMGARIEGIGTDTLVVEGVKRLHGAEYRVMSDRIEAGTYLCAAAITAGELMLRNAPSQVLDAVLIKLREAGCSLQLGPDWIVLKAPERLRAVDLRTAPYPGFPTDMQAQFMALNAVAEGIGVIRETIFENRFMHALEMKRLGANILIDGATAVITGVPRLEGATVRATDLRASAGLVLAALVAEGKTTIEQIQHLDRGYERLEEKLSALGARIRRCEGEDRAR